MTNTVLIKRSGTANSIPTAGNLSTGELAINYNDGNLFYKDTGNAVQLLVSNRFVSVTGNISGGNIAYGTGTVSGTGNILGSNIIATSAISAGSISLSGNVTSALNVSLGIAAGTTIIAVGNITGGNINAGGMSLSGNVISNLNVSANIAAANVTTSGLISATGNITVGNVLTVGIISAAGNIIAGNVNGGATVTANTFNGTTFNGTTVSTTGNITAGNILGGANVNATTHTGATVSVTGNVTAGNVITSGSGGAFSGTGNITAGNILTAGLISAAGNIAGNYFVGNGAALTGIIASAGASIVNGNSNVTVSANSNVTVAVTSSTIATFASTGAYVTGIISATGNITGGNVSGTNLSGSLTTPAQPNITSVGTLSNVSVSGNINAGNYLTGGIVSAVGNITGGNLTGANIAGTLTTASQTNITSVGTLGSLSVTGNVTGGNLTTGGAVSATGNVTAGNILGGANVNATTHTGSTVSVTGNVTGGNLVGGNISGTLITAAQTNITSVGTLTALSVTGNITGSNINAAGLSLSGNVVSTLVSAANITTTANIATGNIITTGSGGSISGTGNITAGNLLTGGIVSATGNVTGNYFIGNGSQLTGIAASYGNANVAANLAAFGSNPISTTGNITAGNILGGANVNATTHTGTTVSVTGNVTGNYFVGNGSQLTGIAASYGNANVAANLAAFGSNPISTSGNITTTANIASGNLITSGSGGSISGTGNITAGNLLTGGIVSATGNVTGNYFIGNGSQLTGIAASYGNANVAANLAAFGSNPISTSGNITAGNILGGANVNATTHTGTTISVTGNVTSGNLITSGSGGSISGTGNITAGNLLTGGIVSATGNVTGNYFIGNGSQLTGIAASYGNANVAANLAAFGSNPISTSGNITGGNILGGANVNATTHTGTTVSVTGNITSGNIITSGFISATGNITGNNAIFTGNLSVAGNVTYISSNVVTINDVAINLGNNAANITQVNNGGIELGPQGSPFVTFLYNSSANTFTSNVGLSAVGNITGGNVNATGLSLSGNVVSALNSTANITTTGNISAGNLITSGSGGAFSGTGNITAGNLLTGGLISATGNVTGNYFIGNGSQLTGIAASYGNANVAANLAAFGSNPISTSGNITAGNILGGANVNATTHTGATVSVTGNVTGNYFIGNGSQLTGIAASYGNANVAANLAAFGSNPISTSGNITAGNMITGGSGGAFSGTGNITAGNILTGGLISATGNISGGNILGGANVNATTHTGTTVSVTSTVTGSQFNGSGAGLTSIPGANVIGTLSIPTSSYAATVSGAAQSNITSVGTLTSLSVTGTITAGNLSVTGNVLGNLLPSANVTYDLGSATQAWRDLYLSGNSIKLGAATMTASGTSISTGSGNITGGNVSTGGNVYTPTNNTGLVGGQTILGQGYAASFNGTSQYLTTPSTTNFNLSDVDWTIETWVYASTTPIDNQNLIQSQTGTNNWSPYLSLGLMANGTVTCALNAVSYYSAQTITLDTWNHLALVRNSGVIRLFINGVASSVVVTSDINNSNLSFWIGKVDNAPGGGDYLYYFNGYLSNLRVVKGLAVYTGTFTTPTGPLTATAAANPFGGANTAAITGTATSLLTLQNSTIIDNSSYGLSITNTGTVTTALQSVPFGSGVYAGTFLYDGATWQSTSIAVTGNTSANGNITGGNVSTGGNVYTPTSNTGLVGGVNGTGGLGYVGSFSGSSQYLTTPVSSTLTPTVSTTPMTIEAWIYPQSYTNGFIVSCTFPGGGAIPYALNFGSTVGDGAPVGTLAFGSYDGGSWSGCVTTATVSLNAWTHLAAVFNGTNMSIYINGVQAATVAQTLSTGGTNQVYVGRRWDSADTFYGYISNLRIVKGLAVYTGTFTTPTSPLTATASANPFGGANTSAITGTATSLLTLQNSTIIDNSTYGLTITNTGSVTTAQQTVPFGSGTTIGTFLYDGTSTWQATPIETTGLTVPVGSLRVSGGSSGYVLSTNGSNTLSWIAPSSGATGLTGATGTAGTNGATGATGTAGSNGATGATGTAGTNGSTGATGTAGSNGSTGATGVTGNDGATGATGASGVNGATGATGASGVNGSTGATGTAGTNGATGATGTIGSTGATGPVAGSNTQVIFNNANAAGASANLTFNNTTNALTLTNGNLYTPTTNTGLVGGVTGVGGLGYVGSFNGSSQYLSFASSAAFGFGTGAYTVECWVYATSAPSYSVFFAVASGGLQFALDNDAYIAIAEQEVGWTVSSTTTLPLNSWNHVAVSRNGVGVTKIYLNGTQIASATDTTNYATGTTASVNYNTLNSNKITGYISNLRVVKGVAVYTGNFTVPTGPLTATASANPFGGSNTAAITGTQTSLLTLQNSTIIDNSTYGLSITNNGSVTTAQQTVPFGSGTGIGTFLYDGVSTWQSTPIETTGLTVPVGSLRVSGGSSGYVLSTNGSNTLSWIAPSSGATGLTGATGATGTAGSNGATGATGTAGTNGATGATGTAGSNGATGATGIGATGATGVTGATGTAGSNGATGATGTAGTDGSTGATGTAGTNGATGATGTAGTNGATGATGTAGSNGATGATGTAGTNGATGATGTAGTNGATGATGTSGTNGATGATGTIGSTGATGPVAGSNTQVIFNDANAAGASANLTFDKTTNLLTVTGNANVTNTLSVFGTAGTSSPPTVEYLVVAGGGGSGGANGGGGGGAGGYKTAAGYAVTSGQTISVTVGAGGAGGTGGGAAGSDGSNSVFGSLTSTGGGGGGSGDSSFYVGRSGGSGGGGASAGGTNGTGGTASPSGQGNAGGDGVTDSYSFRSGAGGGGAGVAGSNATGPSAGGQGGNGLQSSITGTATYYAGGGAGGWWSGTNSVAGLGGGGTQNVAGTANTGGGGGGGTPGNGRAGGSGIVIIRYADSYAAASSTTGTVIYTVAGGYRIYKFTSSGTITWPDTNENSTSPSTGALIVSGGVGIAKDVYTGGLINATGNITGSNVLTGNVLASGNVYTSTTNTGLVGGSLGTAYIGTFAGTNDISVPYAAQYIFGSSNFTIEFWIKPTTAGIQASLFTNGPSVAFAYDNGSILISMSSNGGSWNISDSAITCTVTVGSWSHIALVRNGSVFTLYKNGTSTGTVTSALGLYNPSETVYFASSAFIGILSNYRVAIGVAVYTATFTAPSTILSSTQLANINGNPSAAITGTQTKLLAFETANASTDLSSYAATIASTGVTMATAQSLPFGQPQGTFLYDGATWQSTAIDITGNVTATYLIGNGSQLTGIASSYGNANVTANLAAFGTNPISTSGNITAGNIIGTHVGNVTGTTVSVTGNITGGNVLGGANVNATTHTGTTVSVTGNITGGNILGGANVNATTHTGTTVSVSANVTAGNLITSGFISATGNITGNNAIFTGNLSVAGNVTYIDSNVVTINDVAINLGNNAANITQVNNGGLELGPQGSPFVTFLYNSSANTFTSNVGLSAVANITGGNINAAGLSLSGNVVSTLVSAANITTTANITAGNTIGTHVGNVTGTTVSVTGNITGGNVNAAGLSLSGNVVSVLNSTANITTTANVLGGNVSTGGNVYTPTNNTGLVGGQTIAGQGYVAFFNGTGQYLNIASNAALAFGTGDFTVETWVNPTNTSQVQIINLSNSFQFWVGAGVLNIYDSGTTNTGGTITLNTWQHVAVTRIGTSLKGYINGVQVISVTSSTSFSQGSPSLIGGSGGGPIGYYSNLRVVKGLGVYTGNFTVPTGPLTATASANPFGGANTSAITGTATSLLTLQNSTIIDNSTYGLFLTNTGPVTTAQQTVPFGSGLYAGTILYDGTTWQATPIETTGLTVAVGDLSVTGGSANQVLSTDGSGTMSFKTGSITVVGRAGNISIPVILS